MKTYYIADATRTARHLDELLKAVEELNKAMNHNDQREYKRCRSRVFSAASKIKKEQEQHND